MKVKVFQPNTNGKIEFTRCELEKLLNEVYSDGYNDGKYSQNPWTWYPSLSSNQPYYSTSTTASNASPAKDNIDGIITAATKASTLPSTYTIHVTGNANKNDASFAAEAINTIVTNARVANDTFSKLAVELEGM